MYINKLIILFIFISINLINANLNDGVDTEIVRMSLFDYDASKCLGHSDSYSMSGLDCGTNIWAYEYYKYDECVDFFEGYAIFKKLTNGKIQVEQYNNYGCTKPYYISTTTATTEECIFDCNDFPYSYSIINESQIEYPSNTYISAIYTGACNTNWKESWKSISIATLEYCSPARLGESNMFKCNSTGVYAYASMSSDCSNLFEVYDVNFGSRCDQGYGNIYTLCQY